MRLGGAARLREGGDLELVVPVGEQAHELEVDLQELYVYPDQHDKAAEHDDSDLDDETSRLEDDLLDLEPLLRDAVVLALPFQPLCRDDCPGLCTECGARLADDPDHAHDAPIDPRWAGLQELTQDTQQD